MEKSKKGTITILKFTQSWPSPTMKGHGVATLFSHVFINKVADGEESAEKTSRPGPSDCSSLQHPSKANPRWRYEPVGPCLSPCLGSAEMNMLPACPSLSPPSGPLSSGRLMGGARQNSLNLWGEKRAAERGECYSAGVGINDGCCSAAGEMEKENGSAGIPSPICTASPEEKQAQRGDPATISSLAKAETSTQKNPQHLRLLSASCSGDSALPKAL